MTDIPSSEYKVVADRIVSPDDDVIFKIRGDVYKNSITAENRYVTAGEVGEGGSGLMGPTGPTGATGPQGLVGPTGPAGEGSAADIADFTFEFNEDDEESRMTIHNHDMNIRTTRDNDDQDADIEIRSADDIWMTANDEIEITAVNSEVRIITGAFGQKQWNFRQDGVIGIDGNTGIEVTDDGDIKGRLKFEPGNGRALLQAYANSQTATFTESWDTATWTVLDSQQSQLTLTNASAIISFMDATGYQVDNLKISVNGSYYAPYSGAGTGDGAITLYINELMPPEGEFTLTELRFQYAFSSKVDIDFDEGDLTIRTEDEMDIVLDAADDVIIRTQSGDVFINPDGGAYLGSTATPDAQIATIGDIASASTGDITFVDSTISNDTGDDIVIQNKNQSGVVKSRITLDQSNEQVLIEAINGNTAEYTVADWATATWSGTVIEVTGTANGVIPFFSNLDGTLTQIQVNGAYMVQYAGAGYGPTDITINTVESAPVEGDPLTVTSLRFFYGVSSSINIDYDDGTFDLRARGMSIEMTSTEDVTISSGDDVTIQAGGDDLRLRSWDDTTFTAGYGTDNSYEWRMNNTGRFELPANGYIENPDGASSDGNDYDTLNLVPDQSLFGNDQYLIVEPTFAPTGPGHIHVRAGGNVDDSNADLLLGGERTKVQISDTDRNIGVTTRPALITNTYTNLDTGGGTDFIVANTADIQVGYTVNVGGTDYVVTSVGPFDEGTIAVAADGATFDGSGSYTFTFEPTNDNQWTFGSNGVFYGPAMGGLRVSNILNDVNENLSVSATDAILSLTGEDVNISADDDIDITANGAMRLEAAGGDMNFYMDGAAYIGPSVSENRIAQIKDLEDYTSPTMTQFSPVFQATGLTFTGVDDTYPTYNSYYLRFGQLVTFNIVVDMSTVTNFGTGQFKVDLPFVPIATAANHFSAWAWVDPSQPADELNGHVQLVADHLPNSIVLDLHWLKETTASPKPVIESILSQGNPVTFTTASKLYINGTYIAAV